MLLLLPTPHKSKITQKRKNRRENTLSGRANLLARDSLKQELVLMVVPVSSITQPDWKRTGRHSTFKIRVMRMRCSSRIFSKEKKKGRKSLKYVICLSSKLTLLELHTKFQERNHSDGRHTRNKAFRSPRERKSR